MNRIAQAEAGVRQELFAETAARMGVTPLVTEKDFWVCWTLGRVFAPGVHRPAMLFKGGTSLSKVFRIIERFSEDIDISLDREAFGFVGERDPANATTNTARKALREELRDASVAYIRDEFVPHCSEDFASVIGQPGHRWRLAVDPDQPETVIFEYPDLSDPAAGDYIRGPVRLEFGAASELWPAQDATIQPYAAEHFPDAFAAPISTIRVLDPRRTFWEKATILHAEYHRPDPEKHAYRLSRHYYDVAQLARSPICGEALADLGLLAAVAEHKQHFFYTAWANYEAARPGSLRLVPHEELRRHVEADYRRMAPMFFTAPPAFEGILEELAKLEERINFPAARAEASQD